MRSQRITKQMESNVELYKKMIYKYWSTFEDWKSWVEYQLQHRDQREADPNIIDPNRRNGAILLTLLLPESVWKGTNKEFMDHIYVILEHRSQKLANNPGDISLPGGKMDPEDNTPIDTALREAKEEVGLTRDNLHVIGYMDEFVSNSQMVVYPVVAWKVMSENPENFAKAMKKRYYPRTEESDEVYIVPLLHLIDTNHYMSTPIMFNPSGRNVFIRYFSIDSFKPETHIWGLTASVLRRFIDIVFPSNGFPEEIVG